MKLILIKSLYSLTLIISFYSLISFTKVVKKETISGKVIAITDGDTFKLLTKDSTLIKVRLTNIDCPKKATLFGKSQEICVQCYFW